MVKRKYVGKMGRTKSQPKPETASNRACTHCRVAHRQCSLATGSRDRRICKRCRSKNLQCNAAKRDDLKDSLLRCVRTRGTTSKLLAYIIDNDPRYIQKMLTDAQLLADEEATIKTGFSEEEEDGQTDSGGASDCENEGERSTSEDSSVSISMPATPTPRERHGSTLMTSKLSRSKTRKRSQMREEAIKAIECISPRDKNKLYGNSAAVARWQQSVKLQQRPDQNHGKTEHSQLPVPNFENMSGAFASYYPELPFGTADPAQVDAAAMAMGTADFSSPSLAVLDGSSIAHKTAMVTPAQAPSGVVQPALFPQLSFNLQPEPNVFSPTLNTSGMFHSDSHSSNLLTDCWPIPFEVSQMSQFALPISNSSPSSALNQSATIDPALEDFNFDMFAT